MKFLAQYIDALIPLAGALLLWQWPQAFTKKDLKAERKQDSGAAIQNDWVAASCRGRSNSYRKAWITIWAEIRSTIRACFGFRDSDFGFLS